MKIAIAGASGLVGSALIPILQSDGNQITRLVRSSPKAGEIEWHPNQDEVSARSLDGFNIIINLAGENIAGGRWTDPGKGRRDAGKAFDAIQDGHGRQGWIGKAVHQLDRTRRRRKRDQVGDRRPKDSWTIECCLTQSGYQ